VLFFDACVILRGGPRGRGHDCCKAEPLEVEIEPGWRRVLPPPSDEIGGELILAIRDNDPLPPDWREFE
jgi:hypothetical protein